MKWTEETYGFGHLVLQEFLAAKWFACEKRWENLVSPELLRDPWWHNCLALCLAMLDDATEALERIWNCDLEEISKLRVLAHCLKLAPSAARETWDRILRRILYVHHNGNAEAHDKTYLMLLGIEDPASEAMIRRSLAGSLPTPDKLRKLIYDPRHLEWQDPPPGSEALMRVISMLHIS